MMILKGLDGFCPVGQAKKHRFKARMRPHIYIWYKWFLYLYVHVCISYSSSPPTLSWFRTMECTIRCTFWGSFGSYNKQLNIRETWHDVLIHSGIIVGMWWPHHAFFCILLILACCFQNSKENPSPFFTVIDRNILFLSLQHPLFSCKHSRDRVPQPPIFPLPKHATITLIIHTHKCTTRQNYVRLISVYHVYINTQSEAWGRTRCFQYLYEYVQVYFFYAPLAQSLHTLTN